MTYSFDDGNGNLSTGGVPGIVKETGNIPGHLAPQFFAPTIAGDSMNFMPSSFGVFAQNGSSDFTDGQLTFMVTAKPGRAINNIKFSESGAVFLSGLGTAATKTSDTLPIFITILQIDGNNINNAIQLVPANYPVVFTPKGSFNLATDGPTSLIWQGDVLANLNQVLVDKGIHFTQGVTKIGVNLDNKRGEPGWNDCLYGQEAFFHRYHQHSRAGKLRVGYDRYVGNGAFHSASVRLTD